jgi:hypothetical protein
VVGAASILPRMLGSGLGVLVCLAGAAFGRRYRPPADGTR